MNMERIVLAILALGVINVALAIYNLLQIQYMRYLQQTISDAILQNQVSMANLIIEELDIDIKPKHNTSDGEDK
jgi:hypothetical protein